MIWFTETTIMFYAKTKRELNGPCNICKNPSILTWDHIPPKGGIELLPVQLDNFFCKLKGTSATEARMGRSPDGVKYRTICKDCNSFLGAEFDEVINKLNSDITKLVSTQLIMPDTITVKTYPLRLMKGLIGHLLAARIDFWDEPFENELRDFVLNPRKTCLENVFIAYFSRPHASTITVRDIVMPKVRGNFSDLGFFSVMKYFPMGFIFSDQPNYAGLNDLNSFSTANYDDEAELPVGLKNHFNEHWPEEPDTDNILFGGNELLKAVYAKPPAKKDLKEKTT